MFGYFQFGQPQFGDIPIFVSYGGAGGSGGKKPKKPDLLKTRIEMENRIEAVLIAFLNTQ